MISQQQSLRVQMIGGPGVGKSSFIGALALLALRPRHGYFVTPIDGDTKRRFDHLRASFEHGDWPTKTRENAPIHFRIHRRRRSVSIRLEDFAGESFLAVMQRGDDDEASRRIESLVHDADLLLIMIDGGKLDSGDEISGLPLIQALVQRINVQQNHAEADHNIPVAVVVTKADLCRSLPLRTPQAARKRVTQQVSDVAEFLRTHVDQVNWLPLSVCGYRDDDAGPPPAITFSPAGFERLFELFFTLADQPLARQRKRIAAAVIGLLVLAVAAYHYRSGELAEERSVIENPVVRIQDLPPAVAAVNEAAYRERIRQAALEASEDLRTARSQREVDEILGRLVRLPEAAERLAHDELAALRKQGLKKTEELLYARVQDAVALNDSESIQRAVDQYLKRYPSGPHAEQARMLLASEEDKRRSRSREEISSILVWDAPSLQRKLQRIEDYLKDWDGVIAPSERAAIALAIVAARRMLQLSQYHVTLVRTAGLDRARAHGVRVEAGGVEIARFDDSGTVSEKIWNREFSVLWQLGMKIDVTLLNYRFRNSEIATVEGRGPMAILNLADTNSATRYGPSFASTRPPVSIKFRCEQLDEETVAAIESWVYPGNAW